MRSVNTQIVLSICLGMCSAPFAASHAAPFTTIYQFPPDESMGKQPEGELALGADGNFYGTTARDANGDSLDGTTFRVTPQGQLTTLHAFTGSPDGETPIAGLIFDSAGNLYGTTNEGGADNCGIVYKLAPDGTETILHSFANSKDDGCNPDGGLTVDDQGNLYGTTSSGGNNLIYGTIFKVTPAGEETILHSFELSEGQYPSGTLIRDKDGTLYGTAALGGKYHGGAGYTSGGTVFRLNVDGHLKVLHSFRPKVTTDGANPDGAVVMGRGGYLYGSTVYGGLYGYGAVYRIKRDGSEEALVTSFTGADGSAPDALIVDAKGDLYGVTTYGGSHGFGNVFKLKPSGDETVLHSFRGADGYYPQGALTFDAAGNLYGTATSVGARKKKNAGTIFRIDLKPRG